MPAIVTHRAIDRYIERVEPTDRITAREAILGAERGIRAAAAIGARTVRLANGARLVCIAGRVVTVIEPGRFNNADLPWTHQRRSHQ